VSKNHCKNTAAVLKPAYHVYYYQIRLSTSATEGSNSFTICKSRYSSYAQGALDLEHIGEERSTTGKCSLLALLKPVREPCDVVASAILH